MSVVFVVVPVVSPLVWAQIAALAASATAMLGYRATQGKGIGSKEDAEEKNVVELQVKNLAVVGESVKLGESMTFEADNIQFTLTHDQAGRFKLFAASDDLDKRQLEKAGREVIDTMVQQYTYQRVMEELKSKGFEVVEEGVDEDRRIRVRVQRWV